MSNTTITDETALLIVSCSAAIQQQLYLVIDLLNEQARVFKRLVGKRIRLVDEERRRLAALARQLDRRILEAQELIVSVDTFRRWHRHLIAATYSAKRPGRPRLDAKTEALIVQMATENPTWGEDSIRDRLAELGMTVSDRTVAAVLRRHGIPPAPQREKTNNWQQFLEAHWPHLAALDFATFEIPNGAGRTQRHHALYVITVATREVRLVGITDHVNGDWMLNMARALTDPDTGFLKGMKTVIMDRDPLFTSQVRACFSATGCIPKVLPARSPNLNAYIERFIGTVRREIGRRIIPLSSDHLEGVLQEHIAYYNHERTHQGLSGHQTPVPKHVRNLDKNDPIHCRSRLGKTLNFYYRKAI